MQFKSNKAKVKAHLTRAQKDALEEIGKAAVVKVQRRTPVDTGALIKSIEARAMSDTTIQIGTPIFYSIFVEKGTYKMRAQPYLQPGVLSGVDEYKKIIEKHLSK